MDSNNVTGMIILFVIIWIAFLGIALYVGYWIQRIAVRDGMRDHWILAEGERILRAEEDGAQ